MAEPYHDADTLNRLYWEEGNSLIDLEEQFGVNRSTVYYWFMKHGIPRRGQFEAKSRPWKDEELLSELYLDEGLSMQEISDKFEGAGTTSIQRALEYYDIPTRQQSSSVSNSNNHYELICDSGGSSCVLVHRLQAVSIWGFDAVCGKHIHHQNGIPWDNRPSNLELMNPSEHMSHHNRERWG